MSIIKASSKSADAPQFEDGTYDADFEGLKLVEHPDWAGDGLYGYDDGARVHFGFTAYIEGDPLKCEYLTKPNFNVTSKTTPGAVKVIRALMTNSEFNAFKSSEDNDTYEAPDLDGRPCKVELEHSKSGWPKVVSVFPK